jgi:acyl-CoA thioester hydrolase
MAEWRETFRGVVFPWNCDHIGHMNVRWYAHHFDDAGFHLWSVIGLPQSEMHARGIGLVVAQIKIDYIREMKAGDLLVVKSGFIHVGNRSLKHLARMSNADTGVLCATQETVEVFFDPKTRKSAPMPEDIRRKLLDHVVALDDE